MIPRDAVWKGQPSRDTSREGRAEMCAGEHTINNSDKKEGRCSCWDTSKTSLYFFLFKKNFLIEV